MPSEASGRCLIVILLHELRKLPSGSLSSGSVGSDEFQCICFEPFARSVLTTILSRLKKGLLNIILALYLGATIVISSVFPQSCPVDVILIELLLPDFNLIVKSIVPQVFQDPVLVKVIVSLEPFTERAAVR